MAKYVDIDDLKNKLISSGAICGFGQYLIDIQPTVDIPKERHGRWIKSDKHRDRYICSECGLAEIYRRSRYCPYCGARMEGV